MRLKYSVSLLFAIVLAIVTTSCGGEKKQKVANVEGKGGVKYGGILRTNEEMDFRSLFPHAVNEVTGYRIASQIFEGLVALDQEDLTIQKRLAKSYTVENNATLFRFKLEEGVMFHDDACFTNGKGREITAEDVKYCFDRLCGSYPNNSGFVMFKDRVKGANDYYHSTIKGEPLEGGVSGIRVVDKYTLEIELDYSFAGFVNILATSYCWIFPKEAIEMYGTEIDVHPIGTGAFIAKEIRPGSVVFLEKNKNYWRKDAHGNQLPYLDGVNVSFIKDKQSEFKEFKKNNLDFVFRIPDELVGEVMQPQNSGERNLLVLDVEKALTIQYYGFQHQKSIFKDHKIRQAFTQAIDRKKIITFTLQGNGSAAKYGIVPPAISDYNYKSIQGFEFDPENARKLLKEAGYPNGKGFPVLKLQLNSAEGGRNKMVAEVVKNQLKENLNIDIELEILPWAQHLEKVESGNASMWRGAWLADYPDPETFLNLFYGEHVPDDINEVSYFNSFRYKSEEFDQKFEKALREVDKVRRMKFYAEADEILTKDCAVLPLFYDEYYRLKKPWVKNFHSNAMEHRDLSVVYLDRDDIL